MNKSQYSYERFHTYTLPQIEAKENSEMAYNSHHAVLSTSETAKETYYHSYCCNIRKNKKFLFLAVFDVLCLEFNLDVISNELEGGPVSHFGKTAQIHEGILSIGEQQQWRFFLPSGVGRNVS